MEEKIKDGITVVQQEVQPSHEQKEAEEKKNEKKPSKKLYNPIPESELHSENPIVKAAKKWDKIVQIINKASPHLAVALSNRSITIDADGIIMLFDKNKEAVSKTVADMHKAAIESGFVKASGLKCRVKTAFLQDVEDVLVDYWSLKSPDGAETNEDMGVKEGGDPLDALIERVPELIELADDTAFLGYDSNEDNFSQSSLDDKDVKEEFLDDK